ncbi:nucleotide exchange factor GrpE [Candidatus Woesebacteria bacterium RIFCSPLOWO2_01_FULL_37_19]|uniref:Protein GrpE n=2 Tax=Candidatus Woeseibacteriota TaxID=1752722 RepID=A0A1F8B2C1_9BACT|nr:MAG: nucleotide exchange factor GrpE [Candidatus Woesebacteria bacterium RIFCSPHIGHO2_01_FULL_38_26b]OGM58070.1 MAG: nucleotide exchange factor GrpE [Candidatus Woesebacteria bacterium RIFCSPLOWO2_01_FULL_37_19]
MRKDKKIKETKEVSELKTQLVRALADYDNLRKRVETEKEIWMRFSGERILLKLLPIVDIFEAAQKHLQDQGLAIAINEFKKVFQEEGLVEILPRKDDVFDEQIHEAVESIEGGEKGHIAEQVLQGWRFEDLEAQLGRVIRAAKVKVYRGKN